MLSEGIIEQINTSLDVECGDCTKEVRGYPTMP